MKSRNISENEIDFGFGQSNEIEFQQNFKNKQKKG